jgi:protein-disulfide isomerase
VATQNWPQANGNAMGPSDAKVVVQEFADYQCPYCKQFHDTVLPQIVKQYLTDGLIRYEYHDFLVIDDNVGGTYSLHAAEAARCASDQSRYWDYFNILFTNQGEEGSTAFSDARLEAFAASLGLDATSFNSCLTSGKYASAVSADSSLALSHGLNSTPSLLVNGQMVQNPLDYNAVQTVINAAIAQAGK